MIQILDRKDCCGCTACAERCPHHCITMTSDEEGFLYPVVDEDVCTHCNLCDSVCPVLHPSSPALSFKVYAARHIDPTIRQKSSSGGVFTALAESIIRDGGVVFGAKFDEQWQVVHSYTETMEGLAAFRGSKYVQSHMGNSYHDAELFLKEGRKVLFSGTPCQIAGLKCFLRRDYNNLQTVDIICHGVPSPLVWKEYVKTYLPVTEISFRDKRAGWQKYGFSTRKGNSYNFEIQQHNVFLRGFLQNLFIRPCCFSCRFRNFKSGSDITIADFWGIGKFVKEMDDDTGTNLVIQKNGDSSALVKVKSVEIPPKDYSAIFHYNSSLTKDDQPHKDQALFWEEFQKHPSSLASLIEKYTDYPAYQSKRDRRDLLLLRLKLYKPLSMINRQIRNKWL